MSRLDSQNRTPKVEVQPDLRLRVTDCFDILDYVPKTLAQFLASVELPWGTAHPAYPECRLVGQTTTGQVENGFKAPNDPPPQLFRIYDQMPRNDHVQVGNPDISYDQYGNKTAVLNFIQFSDGSTPYTYTVGTTTAPAPNTDCVLKTIDSTNDGTLIRSKYTFISAGELSDTQELRFGGKLVVRQLTYLNQIPPTPSGWILVTQSTEFVVGLPVYRYGFVNSGGGGGGAGGVISQDIRYGQSVDQGVTAGTTVITIKQISDPSVTSNPIATPSGFILIDVSYEDEAGFRLWTGVYAKGTGTVSTEVQPREDGSIVYEVTTLSAANATPSYPGTGTGYNVLLTHDKRDGYIVNKGTWIKPPATVAYRRQVNFPYPGLAYFVGTDLVLQPGTVQELLGTVTVSFDPTQDTTTPFTVTQWAGFIETYTPTDTGIAVNNQYGMNGYLATGTTISGSGTYKGVAVTSYLAQRFASTPSTLPTGATTISVNNEPYLTDISGTMVFKRSVTTVTL